MEFNLLAPKNVHPTSGYSHAAKIGNLLFVSGQVAKDENDQVVGVGDAEKQTEIVYENLRRVLEAGGSGMDLIGKLTVYTTSIDHRPAINRVRERVFSSIGIYPASTFVVVSGLALPEWVVEIEAIAVLRG